MIIEKPALDILTNELAVWLGKEYQEMEDASFDRDGIRLQAFHENEFFLLIGDIDGVVEFSYFPAIGKQAQRGDEVISLFSDIMVGHTYGERYQVALEMINEITRQISE